MNKSKYLVLSAAMVLALAFASMNLASMLGISTYAAKKVIDIIDAVSTIATIYFISYSCCWCGCYYFSNRSYSKTNDKEIWKKICCCMVFKKARRVGVVLLNITPHFIMGEKSCLNC